MKRILLFLAVLAVAVGGWFLLKPSKEEAVKNTFAMAVAALEKDGTEKAFDALAKARALASIADPQCVFEFRGRKFQLSHERTDVTERIAALRNMSAHIHVELGEVSVSFPAPDTAEATCKFSYAGESFGLSLHDARDVEATLRKDDDSGKWRFSHVKLK